MVTMCIGKRRFLGNPLARRIPPAILALFILIAISSFPGNQVGARGRAEGSFFRTGVVCWRKTVFVTENRGCVRKKERRVCEAENHACENACVSGRRPEIWTMGKSIVWRPLFSDYRFSYRRHSRADAAKHRRFHGQNRPA